MSQGYVLQDDVLPGTSTVWEYLQFHAQLRLPSTCSPRQLPVFTTSLIPDQPLPDASNDTHIGGVYTTM